LPLEQGFLWISLDATVTSISGNNITLSSAATTTAAGVNVTFSPSRQLNAARIFLDKQTGSSESKSSVKALENLIKAYARGDFTLDNKTLNQFINSSTSNTAPNTDSKGNPCLAWNRTKTANTTSASNLVSLDNTSGLLVGMPVAGPGIPGGTTITSVTSNSITLSQNATASASGVSLNFNFTNAYGITYLNKIGPFCGITVNGAIFESSLYPNVNYTATADIYVTNVEILETANPGNVDNIILDLSPRDGFVDLILYGKKAKGRLAVVAKVVNIEFFGYLVGDTFIFNRISQVGTDGDSLGFAMNEDPPVLTPQIALGSTLPFVSLYAPLTGYGKLGLVINPSMRFDPLNPNPTGSDKFTYTNPITQAWSNAIFVDPLIGSGAVASVVADVVNQKIPEVKPKIVQGVVKDIVERVAPDIVNIILKDVNNGVEVNLPSYLPGILKKVKAKVSAAINLDFESRNSGLTSSANLNLDGCLKASTAPGPCVAVPPSEAPPAVQTSAGAVDSFLTFKVPSNFTCSSTAGSPNLNCTGIGSTLSCTSIKDNFTVSCGSVGSLAVGNYVYGVNLPLGSYVTNISGLNVTLSKPASNAGAFTLTYSSIGPGFGVMGTNLASGSFVTNLSGTNLTLNKNALSTGSFTGYFSTIFGKAMMDTINSARTGVLIALHPDAVNQAVYHLWQKGALNLKLDLLFADEIAQNQYSGDTLGYRASTRILEIYQILLKAKSILRILAPGKTNMTAGDPPVLIEEDDDIAFTLNPILPPVIKPASGSPVPGISGTIANEKSGGVISGQIAKVEVFLGDLILNISGQKCISRNPISGLCTITGASYPIIKAKVSLTSKATFKIANFSNPFNDPHNTHK